MSLHESVVTIPGPVPLHGILHGCCEVHEPAWGMVICDPFAEEKKCAHRALVEAARAFCAADVSCLRFDYRGTGDSPGEFVDAGPEQWLEDIRAAVAWARAEMGLEALGLLGLRLGATMAAQLAAEVDFLVLWEPVLDGRQFMAQNLRRSQIKAMLTTGDEAEAAQVREAHTAETFDFDGYRISATTREQIEGLSLKSDVPSGGGPALVLQLTSREQPGDDYVRLAEELGGTAGAVRQEPFWNRLGLSNPRPVIERTELWLAEQQAARLEAEG